MTHYMYHDTSFVELHVFDSCITKNINNIRSMWLFIVIKCTALTWKDSQASTRDFGTYPHWIGGNRNDVNTIDKLSLDVMRQSACLFLNPLTVYSYGFLFNFTTVGQASDSMTALM